MDDKKTVDAEPNAKRIRTSSIGNVRPNFFVAVQVSNPVIHRAVNTIQNIITSKKPLYKSVSIKLITLHITLCTMYLAGNESITRAKSALMKLEMDTKELLAKDPISLKFKGIGSFNNEVVYAKIEPGEPLTRIKNLHVNLVKALKDEGLIVEDKFSPHLTIMKMSMDKSLRKKRIYRIPKSLYEEEDEMLFGDQIVRSIQLLRIGDHAENAYYNCYHYVDLGTGNDELEDHVDCCGVKSVVPTIVIELTPEASDVGSEVQDGKLNVEASVVQDGKVNAEA